MVSGLYPGGGILVSNPLGMAAWARHGEDWHSTFFCFAWKLPDEAHSSQTLLSKVTNNRPIWLLSVPVHKAGSLQSARHCRNNGSVDYEQPAISWCVAYTLPYQSISLQGALESLRLVPYHHPLSFETMRQTGFHLTGEVPPHISPSTPLITAPHLCRLSSHFL